MKTADCSFTPPFWHVVFRKFDEKARKSHLLNSSTNLVTASSFLEMRPTITAH